MCGTHVLIIFALSCAELKIGSEMDLVIEDYYPQDSELKDGKPTWIPQVTDFLSGKLLARKYTGEWLSDTEFMHHDYIENFKTGDVEPVFNRKIKKKILDFSISGDRRYVLVLVRKKSLWRNSHLGRYLLVDREDVTNDTIIHAPDFNRQCLRLVKWAPTGNSFVYVDDNNNIFYRASVSDKSVQLTKEGVPKNVFCGVTDWVYEEEVLSSDDALWWSPDSKKLAFAIFNDEQVETYSMPHYGDWKGLKQMPTTQHLRYPIPGSRNPEVQLWIAIFKDGKIRQKVELDKPMNLDEPLLTQVLWLSNSSLLVNWMNRVQNESLTMICWMRRNVHCSNVMGRIAPIGWVEIKVDFTHTLGENGFMFLGPDESKDGMIQIYRHYTNGDIVKITKNRGDVTKILKYTKNHEIYFIGVKDGDRKTRHLFRQKEGKEPAECLTCHLGLKECDFVEASMSTEGEYIVLDCRGVGIPFTLLYNTNTDKVVRELEANKALRSRVSSPLWQRVFLSLGRANIEIILPIGVSLYSEAKLPAVLYVYGGPGDQNVRLQWEDTTIMTSYLVASRGYIGVKMDVRGSGYAGARYKMANYRNFGTKEIDETALLMGLLTKFPAIDPERVGVYGWSYGGFYSLNLLSREAAGVFKCGVSVAPVALWQLYDSVYTERYMSTPEDNPFGYNLSTPLWNIQNLREKKYLLVHGTEDDNVHLQHSMYIAQELQRQNIVFNEVTYPDQNHGLKHRLQHLFLTITSFFEDCFQQ